MPIIIDTDPGIDDALALVYALNAPQLEVVGVTTVHGNVSVERTTRNALGLLELASPGTRIPVARGAAAPLQGPAPGDAGFVHGIEGLGDTPAMTPRAAPHALPAWQFICQRVAERPGEITLCAIGPLTNLAHALAHSPSVAEQVAGVVVMGGAFRVPGNITAHAEYNFWSDPDAAAAVLAAPWPITLVGLDVTTQVICSSAYFRTIAKAAPRVGGFVAQLAEFYIDFYRRHAGLRGCQLHDPSALIALTHPALFTGESVSVSVNTHGQQRGQMLHSASSRNAAGQAQHSKCNGNVTVLTDVDVALVKEVFMLTLAAADHRRQDS